MIAFGAYCDDSYSINSLFFFSPLCKALGTVSSTKYDFIKNADYSYSEDNIFSTIY